MELGGIQETRPTRPEIACHDSILVRASASPHEPVHHRFTAAKLHGELHALKACPALSSSKVLVLAAELEELESVVARHWRRTLTDESGRRTAGDELGRLESNDSYKALALYSKCTYTFDWTTHVIPRETRHQARLYCRARRVCYGMATWRLAMAIIYLLFMSGPYACPR